MNVFERQWVLRDFKKSVGLPADGAAETPVSYTHLFSPPRRPTALQAAPFGPEFKKISSSPALLAAQFVV